MHMYPAQRVSHDHTSLSISVSDPDTQARTACDNFISYIAVFPYAIACHAQNTSNPNVYWLQQTQDLRKYKQKTSLYFLIVKRVIQS